MTGSVTRRLATYTYDHDEDRITHRVDNYSRCSGSLLAPRRLSRQSRRGIPSWPSPFAGVSSSAAS